ncbi:MAG TPA: helix-turn-helix domain-containing protein [Candidatus Acetothermia bacterium]|nr:helix-turn-helix domain-containing protein [Candidatus Acetothermia bacterium]
MTPSEIVNVRRALGLSQVEFARLFDVHSMTVSKWERGLVPPTPYQVALMDQFRRATEVQQAKVNEQLKNLLVSAGVIAALFFLLKSANE